MKKIVDHNKISWQLYRPVMKNVYRNKVKGFSINLKNEVIKKNDWHIKRWGIEFSFKC